MDPNFTELWPKRDQLVPTVMTPPYNVLSELAESVKEAYGNEAVGIVTASFKEDSNMGEKCNFIDPWVMLKKY